MQFNPALFDQHLANMGQQISWSAFSACPCVNVTSGQPDTKCPHCGGTGHLWAKAVDTVCGITSQKTQARWASLGLWQDGDIVVTIPASSPMWDGGRGDRVVMRNGSERFSMTLTRGAPNERMPKAPESIDRVFWLDKGAGRAIVEGSGRPTVDAAGRLTWGAGAPPLGTQYAINGRRLPTYFCLGDLPASRNEHSGMQLPKRVVLRRFDLFGRGNQGQQPT